MAQYASTNHYTSGRDSRGEIPYHWQRSDALLQDKVLHPETVRMVLEKLAVKGGDLAYTPEMVARASTVLQQRYETDIGNDIFVPPNYGPYDDPELAAFYGIDTSEAANVQTRKENFDEQRLRLADETARQLEVELPGLAQMMEHYRIESWARHGIADEAPYIHKDPDITLLRNPGRGWCSLDRPIATSDHTNVIDMYQGEPEYVFPTPHQAWEVDRLGGYYNSLS